MARIWRSFFVGWATAAHLWPLALLLYAVDACLALILAIPPAGHLARVFGRSATAADLLGPWTLNLMIEASDGWQELALAWPLYVLIPLLFLLISTFLRGGTLGAMAGEPNSFRWPGFFSDCARFFGRLLLLLLFFVPGLALVALIVAGAALAMGLLGLPAVAIGTAAAALVVFLLFLLLATLDYARASLVLAPERSVPRHAGRGLAFLGRRFPQALALGLGFLLAAALIAAVYPALTQLSPLFATFLPALLLQQLVALLATWQRLALLAGEMALYRGG